MKSLKVTPGRIYTDCATLLFRYATPFIIDNYSILMPVVEALKLDLQRYVDTDPAANGSHSLVYETYRGFQAILHYRVAHSILQLPCQNEGQRVDLIRVSRIISEISALKTGVEIHPAAEIGIGFVIDHGYNSVIGETSSIGKNCTILNGVVLGSRGIAGNGLEKRHPTLEDNVEVGGGTKIFGPVTVGENSFLGPGLIISKDVLPNSRIYLKTTHLVEELKEVLPFSLN